MTTYNGSAVAMDPIMSQANQSRRAGPHAALLPCLPQVSTNAGGGAGAARTPLRALFWNTGDSASLAPIADARTVPVLLHGLGDGADIWRPVLDHWPGQAPPIMALDLPGHGGSGRLPEDKYRVPEIARVIAAALHHLRLERVVLIGHSVGAGIALHLAGSGLMRPHGTILIERSAEAVEQADAAVAKHVDGLIVGATDLDRLITYVRSQLPLADARATTEAITALARQADTGWHLPIDPAVKRLLDRSANGDGEWALLKAVQGPVAIVRGQYSSFLPLTIAERMAAMARSPVTVETITRSGHAISLEQPAALAACLARQIARFHGNC
ncbi:alpha/beta fold hydrolase [Yoonia sp. R2-816]|uniref:alpha/beta fold hydrolase n=1 Tax=Yoonia sp. R2-816 TaxID=3342638 RepID=UPI00372BBDE6